MEIKLVKTEKSTATISVTIPPEEVVKEEQHTLEHLASEVTVKGFRQGKAPLPLVKKQLKEGRLLEETINHLIGHALNEAIREHQLKVIANPSLTKSETKPGASWEFILNLPLYPKIDLGTYQENIKAALKTGKPEDNDKKLRLVFDTLLDKSKIEIPQALIDEEVNRSLARLVTQSETLNLSLADYLKSIKRTPQELREEYQKTATDSLKLDFLLFAVANDLKLTASPEETEEFAKTAQVKENQKLYLRSIILKRKAVDSLLKL